MENIKNVILKRHTMRRYKPGPDLNKLQLDTLIDAAHLAPTGMNLQDSQIVIVTSPEKKSQYKVFFEGSNQVNIEGAKALILYIGTPFKFWLAEGGKRIRDTKKDIIPKEKLDETVNNILHYYTRVSKFTDINDIYSSTLQLGFILLQATDLGFATTPMLGFDPDKLADFMLAERIIEKGQRVNIAMTLGYADEKDELNIRTKDRHRLSRENMFKII